jgi:crotonobetainyl-CoA:carnitine CoA-transferase CaiB-like acyl-CoA transferase
VGQPIMMSRTPSHIASPPPLAGGDADDILAALGYSADDIAALRKANAI